MNENKTQDAAQPQRKRPDAQPQQKSPEDAKTGKKKRKKKKKKRRIFWKIYWFLFLLAALGVAATLYKLNDFLIYYEKAQPFYKMDEVLVMFREARAADILAYEPEEYPEHCRDVITEVLFEQLENKAITYRKKYGEFTQLNPVYTVYADDNEVATVYLRALAERDKYDTKQWELKKITGLIHPLEDIDIVAPDNAVVYVDGVALKESDIVSTEEIEGKSHFEKYTENFPKMAKYHIGDIYRIPREVTCVAPEGGSQVQTVSDEYPFYSFGLNEHEEVTEEKRAELKKFVSAYVDYCMNDGKFDPIEKDFLNGTATYERMLKIKGMSVYAGRHTKVEKSEIDVTEYIIYSPDAYKMTLDFTYTVYNGAKSRENPTILDIYYVKIDGEWKIVEMNISSNY